MALRKIEVERVTVVKFRVDNRGSDGTGCFRIEARTDTAELSDMRIASSSSPPPPSLSTFLRFTSFSKLFLSTLFQKMVVLPSSVMVNPLRAGLTSKHGTHSRRAPGSTYDQNFIWTSFACNWVKAKGR